MHVNPGSIVLATLILVVSGCTTAQPPQAPPAQVQFNFNLSPQDRPAAPKHLARAAMSGAPQRVGFFYSVNPDCSSDGLVQLQLKTPPSHGSVAFVKADGYTNFPSPGPGHECNTRKSPGMEVMYTSVQDFVGMDQFTVQGVGPHGVYLETEYAVKVIAP